jgi:hypothetical protein
LATWGRAVATLGIYGEHDDWASVCLQGCPVLMCIAAFSGASLASLRELAAFLKSRGADIEWTGFGGDDWRSPTPPSPLTTSRVGACRSNDVTGGSDR